jgi:antitoxin component YwqK of YwqJK toxin-antitoxin module
MKNFEFNDKKEGLYIEGNRYKNKCLYKNGMQHGEYIGYYPNGNIWYIHYY